MKFIPKSREKTHRISIYLDCIIGSIIAISAIIAIIFIALNKGIESPGSFTISLVFWISWLLFSLFLISIGIYTYYQEKHFIEKRQKKKLKPPMVS